MGGGEVLPRASLALVLTSEGPQVKSSSAEPLS